MNNEIVRQRILRAVQSVALVGALVFLAARAVSVLFGPVAGWSAAFLSVAVVWLQAGTGRGFVPRGARPVGRFEAPELVDAFAELVRRAEIESTPRLYYLDRPEAVAFTTGFGTDASIVVSRGLLSTLTLPEIVAVLAHEIAHIRNHDLRLFAVVDAVRRLTRGVASLLVLIVLFAFPLVALGVVSLPAHAFLYVAVIPIVSLFAQRAFLRTREFQADIGAVELTGDGAALARALSRLDAFGPRWGRTDRLAELFRTHPDTRERIDRIGDLEHKPRSHHWISV